MTTPVWLDYANSLGTLAAAGLAYIAIRQAAKQSNQNQRALISERRIDFELGLLSDLAEQNERSSEVFGRDARMRTLASMLSIDLIPLTRAALELDSTEKAMERLREVDTVRTSYQSRTDFMRAELAAEILGAVKAKLEVRDLPARRRAGLLRWKR